MRLARHRGGCHVRGAEMTDQQQRTQWALDVLLGFIRKWTPEAARPAMASDEVTLNAAIVAIAPRDVSEPIGYGVFRREIDADWDIRQRPSGWVHTLISAVFDKPAQAENVHASQTKKYPDQHFIICEIREIP